MASVTVQHVDTCLSCYVLDHCNGEAELLLGVPVDGASLYRDVRDDLVRELQNDGDKLPEHLWDAAKEAILEAFADAELDGRFDPYLETNADDDSDFMGEESCFAWFRLSWDGEEHGEENAPALAPLPASRLEPVERSAPAHWACYLLNGDVDGLDLEELAQADAWIAREGLGLPVSCEESGFQRWHDAQPESPRATHCEVYTFLVPRSSQDGEVS